MMGKLRQTILAICITAIAFAGRASAITINFDFSLDNSGFFTANPQAISLLHEAAAIFEPFTDSLTSITPGGANTYKAALVHPSTGAVHYVPNLALPGDELLIYVGGRDLDTSLAEGGPGGYDDLLGSAAFRDSVRTRGQPNATGNTATDFGVWGGSIAINSDLNNWGFTGSAQNGKYDFFSIVAHEIAHILGFGASDSFDHYVTNGTFTGPNVLAVHGSAVGLDSVAGHWTSGTRSTVHGIPQTAIMVSSIGTGIHREFTQLDFAALADIGWEVPSIPPIPGDWNADGVVDAFDMAPVLSHWGNTGVTDWWPAGDPNRDGVVDAFDLTAVLSNWGAGFPESSSVHIIPEPTVWLTMTGLVPLLIRRRR